MNKKTLLTLIIIVVAACAVLFAGCVGAANRALPKTEATAMRTMEPNVAFADSGDAIVVDFYDFYNKSGERPSDSVVRTKEHFVYMLKDTGSSTYTLGNDFYVTALLWDSRVLSNYATQRSLTIKGGYTESYEAGGETVTVNKKHRITYAPNLDNEDTELSTSQYGGLFAQFGGTMENVEYVFRGKMEVDMFNISFSVIYYGGFAGRMSSAHLKDCEIVDGGTILTYANKPNCTIYAGGIAGYIDGCVIEGCTLSIGGGVSANSYQDTSDEDGNGGDNVTSTRNNKLYAGGLSAIVMGGTTISNSTISARGAITTSDNAVETSSKNYNGDEYLMSAGGVFGYGCELTMTGCDVTIGGRINSSGSQYTSVNGTVSGGLFGLVGSYSKGGTATQSLLILTNNIMTLSCTVSAVTNREHKDASWLSWMGIGDEAAVGGSTYHGGIVGRFNGDLDGNSRFGNNAILYYATIEESAKYDPTDGKSYYGYLSGNSPDRFASWNKGNNWTVLEGDEETNTIRVRQSTGDSGVASNGCGDIGVLMVFGGGRIKAEIESNKLQFSANQVYSPFDKWYADIEAPLDYTKSNSYKSGEVFTEERFDVNGDPYTKYIFRPQGGSKTVYAVFLTKEIKDAGTFVQWTEEMNKGLNKTWIEVRVTEDFAVTKGVNIVNTFNGKFLGNGHTIIFQNGVTMVGVDNLTAEEMTSIFGSSASGEDKKGAVAGIFRVNNGIITDLNLVFAGKMYAGTYSTTPVETHVAAGFLVGVNNGTVKNIDLSVPQAGSLFAVSEVEAYGGGLVGIDNNTVTNVTANIQGNYSVQSAAPVLGGVIGLCNTGDTKTYANFNVDIKGQLECSGNSSVSGNSYAAGLVGVCSGKLALQNVIVNIRDKSNMDGDVLVNNCANNINIYTKLIKNVDSYVANTNVCEDGDIDDIADLADDLGVGTASILDLNKLKSNIAFVKARIADTEMTSWYDSELGRNLDPQTWFNKNVRALAKTLDCNAPCASCKEKAVRAYYCANIKSVGYSLTYVWAIGSYTQYAGDETYGAGVSYISYFGSAQNVAAATNVGLNLIYVRNGTAEGKFEDKPRFTVPVEDSAHVFTGWYVDYNHTVMVASNLLSGNAFTPGNQSGGVWYSSVINRMIMESDELSVLASTTNAGQRYTGVSFTLGCDIVAASEYNPIGTEENPFRGTFDGQGFSVTFTSYLDTTAIGMFGCLGTGGTVKQVVVKVKPSVDYDLSGNVFGAVVAINYGTVGQNSQNERVRAEIYRTLTGANIGGGIVGVNKVGGLVFNTETDFIGLVEGGKTYQGEIVADYVKATDNYANFTAAGGAVGHNEGTVRNVKVSCHIGDLSEYIDNVSAANNKGAAYAGGLVAYNESELYSGVVEVFFDEPGKSIAYANGNTSANSHSAILVGYNTSSDVDALWATYQLDTEGFVTPADNALINGQMSDIGNRLVRYGYGSVSAEIYANTDTQPKGGNILFSAAVDETRKVPFYAYTQSLDHGEQVADAAGSFYSPAITTDKQTGLGGKTYYAVFADAEINTEAEYYKFVEMVNKGFKAYVSYILRLKSSTALVLQATDARYASIGAGDNVFVGSFDGSGKDIEIKCTENDYATVPMFGTIGATSEVSNFTFTIEPTLRFRLRYTYEGKSVVGAMAYVNLGRIYNVTYKLQSGIYGDAHQEGDSVVYADGSYATYAGGLVGYNGGHIDNSGSGIALNSSTVGGINMAARVFGQYAGGIAGYNAPDGWIGSEAVSSIVIVLNTDTLPSSIVGIKGAGAIVGLNEGTVANAVVTIHGIVGAPVVSGSKFVMGATKGSITDDYLVDKTDDKPYVGGIAGYSTGTIYGSRVTIGSTAVLRASGGNLGAIVGSNDGGTLGVRGVDDSIKVYWQANTDVTAECLGGVAGYNTGELFGAVVSIDKSITGKDYVGGVVGYNATTGYLSTITLSVNKNATLSSSSASGFVGGLVGYNKGRADACGLTINGTLGSAASGNVGGFAGYTSDKINNSYVVLYKNLVVADNGNKGLAVGYTSGEMEGTSPKSYGVNAWAVAFNSDRTLACSSDTEEERKSGFNILKIVSTEMVTPSIVKYSQRTEVRFTSLISSNKWWYSDIKEGKKDTGIGNVFKPDSGMHNERYHLCAYDLDIDNASDLANLYTFVNSADLFNGVMFQLINDITVPYGANIQPIGSMTYPFTGIFEGDGHTITLEAGSIVVGSQLSGLFGCIAEGAVVRNFIMQVDADVLIGSTTDYVGALAGYIYGEVDNVAVNLISAPRSSKEGATVGALAGYVGDTATFANVWVVSYNGTVEKPVGDDRSAGAYNVIDVYGRGKIAVVRGDEEWQNNRVMQFSFNVVKDEGLAYFDNWYSDFVSSTVFNSTLGSFRAAEANGEIKNPYYQPLRTLTGSRFTASFIKMVIENEQDFYNFVNNINTYGVKDGQFRFDLGRHVTSLTIDLSRMQPIGTVEHPFRATLDGSVTAYANPDSDAYTLVLKGTIQNAEYSGLFGYIGEGAVIRNLVVRADKVTEQSIGYRESIYTGFFAGYAQGSALHPVTIESVVVEVNTNTTLINSHADAIGGVAGLLGSYVNVSNTWCVLPENGQYSALGSCRTADGIKQYTETFPDAYPTIALPNTMYLCGDGYINYKHVRESMTGTTCAVNFELTSGEKYPFGFIEKLKDSDLDQSTLPHNQTFHISDAYSGKVYLALYVKTTVESEADLLYIADLVNVQNRSYLGVTFTLTDNITLSTGEWTPIGGAVETYQGSGEYKQVAFIGAFDGNGYTITMPEGMTCSQQYAGLFGILADTARIRNLRIECNAAIGSSSTQYAGVLAGIDQGARLKNIIVDVGQVAVLSANMQTSRVAVNRSLVYDVNGKVTNYASVHKAENVWVLNRNSRYSSEQNIAEQSFYDTLDTTWDGVYNGGINVVTVIANGTVSMQFKKTGEGLGTIVGVIIRNADAESKPIRMWYTAPNGVVTTYGPLYNGSTYANEYTYLYDADNPLRGLILYASFLNEFIGDTSDLVNLAVDVAVGCDLYGLTFYLMDDVVIDQAAISDGFVAIGTEATPFSATFNGNGHVITLAEGTLIRGKTAGIFGILGEYGTVRNVKLDLKGTIGYAGYTATEVANGKVNTLYAGAVAVSYGNLDSVIIDATRLTVSALGYGYAAASIAYDYSNYYTNTWLVVSADNTIANFGKVEGGTASTINVMRVIGMGRLKTSLQLDNSQYYVCFTNDTDYTQRIDGIDYSYTIRGWYSNFAEDNQLSEALNITALYTGITAGDNGTYLAADDIFNKRFEVAIMSRVIVSEDDLIAIAHDVNEGGYTFENTTFTLGHDVTISSTAFRPIGTYETHFLGTFQGAYNGDFFKIVINRHAEGDNGQPIDDGASLFGYMYGVVENLIVELQVDMLTYSESAGVIANNNYGVVRNSLVRIYRFGAGEEKAVTVYGTRVGGVVGYNAGTVSNCIVYIAEKSALSASRAVGGLVGQNEGIVVGSTNEQFDDWRDNEVASATLEPWYATLGDDIRANVTLSSVLLDGKISVVNATDDVTLFAGGAVGESRNRATVNRVTVIISATGVVTASGKLLEVGGLAGRSLATMSNSVLLSRGEVSYTGTPDRAYCGHFIGNLQGSAPNCWLVVPVPPTVSAIGNGSSVNVLQINGNGVIDTYLDAANNIIFRDITPTTGAALDGWYINSGIQVPDDVGGVDSISFRPNRNITGYTVNVIFINTQINTVADLEAMATTVNAGLFSTGLTFTLMGDLTIDVASSRLFYDLTIGTTEGESTHAFKHVFDGNGYVIRVTNSSNKVYGGACVGLFGYTGQDAVIRDLTLIVESGIYGVAGTTKVLGALVAENKGTIEDCDVYLGCYDNGAGGLTVPNASTSLIAANVGGIVGTNYGTIKRCSVTSHASLQAETTLANATVNRYIGGVVGNNHGTVSTVDVYLYQSLGNPAMHATDASGTSGTSYVGGVAGNNAIEISNVYIELHAVTIESRSAVQAYAGGICGSNTGSIRNSYVAWDRVALLSDNAAGGIVGTNNNNLAAILIDFAEGSTLMAGADSAVANTGNYGTALNVWVFNHTESLNSRSTLINNMTQGATSTLTHNDSADVRTDGRIVFEAGINAANGLTVYADADTAYKTVRLDDFLSYNGGRLRLTTYSTMTGVHVRSEIRRTLGDQTELKAMARALAVSGQAINGTYTLSDDITVDGEYLAIGTSSGTSFSATLEGEMHRVTFTKDVVFTSERSMFGVLTGTIDGLVVAYECDMSSVSAAGVTITNNGRIADIVIYTADGVGLTNPTYKNGSPSGNGNGEVWVVARESISASSSDVANRYGVIIVNGNGTLDAYRDKNDDGSYGTLYFHSRLVGEHTTFAGYSNVSGGIVTNVGSLSDNTLFNVKTAVSANNNNMSYTAEFLSTAIAESDDFEDLLGLLNMGYQVEVNTVFTLVNDIEVSAAGLKRIAPFTGVLDGAFHTLKVNGNVDKAFGNFNSSILNMVIDSTDLVGDSYLFDNDASATLSCVVIRRSGKYGNLQLGNSVGCTSVFIVSPDAACAHPDKVGLIVESDVAVSFATGNGGEGTIRAIAGEDENLYFVGWYRGDTLVMSGTTLGLAGPYTYRAHYLSKYIAFADDLSALSRAVANGYTFEGAEFVVSADAPIDYKGGAIIGDATHTFAGTVYGGGKTIEIDNVLFRTFRGTMSNLQIVTSSDEGLASVVDGKLRHVVVRSSNATPHFAASVTDAANREMDQCWLIATYGEAAPVVSGKIKCIRMGANVSVSVDVATMCFTATPSTDDYFLLWRDKEGKVLFNKAYDTLAAEDATASFYGVEAGSEVGTDDEYAYFALATAHGYTKEAKLKADINVYLSTPAMTDVFQLDGDGHTMYIHAPVVLGKLTAKSGENCHIYNVVFEVMESVKAFTLVTADDGVTDKVDAINVVFKSDDDVDLGVDANCVNVWYLSRGAMRTMAAMAADYATIPADVNVLLYELGDIGVSFTRSGKDISGMTAQAIVGSHYHFLGYYEGANAEADTYMLVDSANRRVQAFFAHRRVETAAQWTHAALAMRYTGNVAVDFTLTKDIEADVSFVPFVGYKGTLDGDFNSVIIKSDANLTVDDTLIGVVGLAEGGRVSHLAVEVNAAYPATDTLEWLAAPTGTTVSDCVLINYTAVALNHSAGVRMITVVDQAGDYKGHLNVDKATNTFAFNPVAFASDGTDVSDVYRLRFYSIDATDYDVSDADALATVLGAADDIKAKFYYCYTVSVQVEGVSKELVRGHLTESTPYWLGFAYSESKVEFTGVVQGYMFAGFSYKQEAAAAIGAATYTSLSINVGELANTGSITITARFILIQSSWAVLTYGDKTQAEIREYLKPQAEITDMFADPKFSCTADYTFDSNVLQEGDDNTPYHAGSYIVEFSIEYDGVEVGRSDGLSFQIEARTLYFETLRVSVKKYDGKPDAKIDFAEIGGFAQSDIAKGCKRQYAYKDTVFLEYFDLSSGEAMSNVGTWYLRIKDGSYLATSVLNSDVLFDDDYVLPTGALYKYAETAEGYVKTDNLYTAIISKQDLELVVSDISINYLDQFGSRDENNNLIPFNISKYLSFQRSGGAIYGVDKDLFDDGANKPVLLRIVGDTTSVNSDSSVNYCYTIRNVGSYSIEVIKDVLVNYEPKISENKATFTIKPSPASVRLNPALDKDKKVLEGAITMQYGDTLTALSSSDYVVSAGNAVTYFTDAEFEAVRGLYTNLTAANKNSWFAMTLVPECAFTDDESGNRTYTRFNVASIGTAGVQFRFIAANKNFTLADSMQKMMVINSANEKEYLVDNADVLVITKRHITYNITSDLTKAFGSEDTPISGRAVGKTLMNGDALKFRREAGEFVGSYPITAYVVDRSGYEVTANYELSAYNNVGFAYQIERRTVVVQRTGNGVFSFGSSDLQKMPNTTNLSESVKQKMFNAFKDNGSITGSKAKNFNEAIVVSLGYFGKTRQSVGTYEATLKVTYNNIKASDVEQSLVFVLDEKSKTYEIIRASLTVRAKDAERDYDTTARLVGMTDKEIGIEIEGWADDSDADRIGIRVGSYVCDGLTRDAGTYFYSPSDMVLYDIGSGDDGLLGNYVIGTVIGANFVINRVSVTISMAAGVYDEDGSFVNAGKNVSFGDKTAKWYFGIDAKDMPAFLAEAYANADLTTDWDRSEWLRKQFNIVARNIASLPSGTIVSNTNSVSSKYYLPSSSDKNVLISASLDTYFKIGDVAIIITDVRFDAESAKSEPTMSFTVAAYATFERNTDNGSITVTGSPIDDYFDEIEVSGVKSGERVMLNENYAVSFSFSSYDVEQCTYNLSSYVNDGVNWVTYRDVSAETPILYVAQTDEEGESVYVSYNRTLTDEVNMQPGVWASIAAAIADNPVALAIALVALLALVAMSVVAAILYRRRRLLAKVKRDMNNEDILSRMGDNAPIEDASATDGAADGADDAD